MNNCLQELIIQEENNLIKIIVLEDNKIVEFYEFDRNNMPRIGNIYRAKVKDINDNFGSIFVYFNDNEVGYIDRVKENVNVNEEIVVMLKREAYGSKNAKMTMDISIAGKYIVLLPNSDIKTVSKKCQIDSNLINKIDEYLPNGFGYIMRSESKGIGEGIIIDELKSLIEKWETIKSKNSRLLYDANDIIEILLREFCRKNVKKLFINSEYIYEKIKKYLDIEIDFEEETNFLEKFGMVSQLDEIWKRKIWLKSSGFINIDFTEALTAIDVNSGKFLGNSSFDKEDISFKVNEEASIEVMRQLRLKNVGGIIVVDFINMKSQENKEKIIEIMQKEALKDRSKVEIYGFTNLGLVEMARKKV